MSTSRLKTVVAQYKAALKANEARAEHALNAAHQHTLRAIQPQLDKLYREVAAKQQAGEKVPLSWLYEGRRLQATKAMIEHEIDHYGALARMQTGQLQHTALQLGQSAASAQLQATVPAGVRYAFGVPSPQAIANMVGVTQDGSPLADLFAGFGREAAQKASDALITGITNGDNPRVVAKYVQDALDISRQRALVIAQDQMVNAYRASNLATMQANRDVLEGWVWVADLGGACLACTEQNGSVHSVDEDMESHVRCECVPAPLTKSWDDILSPLGIDTSDLEDTSIDIPDGATWFAQQPAATQQQILGSTARYQAYKGGVSLYEKECKKHDPKWGTSIYIKPMKELTKAR